MDSQWKATLSNGEVIYENNGHNDVCGSWTLLIYKLRKENLKIVELELHYNNEVYTCDKDAEDYFQCRSICSDMQGVIGDSHGVGHINDGVAYITWVDHQGNTFRELRDL